MAKKTRLSKLHQPIHPVLSIILIGLVVIAGISALVIRSNHYPIHPFRQNEFQTYPTFAPRPTDFPIITPTHAPASSKTYTSDKLGIRFTYLTVIADRQNFFTKEIGDTVYLYYNLKTNQPFVGSDAEFLQIIAPGSKYVEVFNKYPQLSLQDAIKQQFLTGYAETDCFVKATPYGHPRGQHIQS